jgi:hypothetical protein
MIMLALEHTTMVRRTAKKTWHGQDGRKTGGWSLKGSCVFTKTHVSPLLTGTGNEQMVSTPTVLVRDHLNGSGGSMRSGNNKRGCMAIGRVDLS